MVDLAELRRQFKSGKQALIAGFMEARPTVTAAKTLLRQLARHVDSQLLQLWSSASMPEGACLLAVGGYGRGELFPYSDIDVLVLLPDSVEAHQPGPIKNGLEAFITACWDMGLEIGSSVRTLTECLSEAAGDVTVQTAMLEARLLAGPKPLFKQFERALQEAMDPKAFCAPRRWRRPSATPSTKRRPTRSSPIARKARAACATCSC